ncbi:hypothetical protein GCM10023091_36800 [Ravibacter arvi]|uniref:Fibronectin type-III domain-containing protein n=1 Tax=Ravibacter arvi TaxID=2051041 RepID=A0ABP8M7T8_9BACT
MKNPMLSIFVAIMFPIAGWCQTFTPTPEIVNLALGASLARWKADPATNQEYLSYGALESAKIMNYLALVAYHDPSNTTVINRLLDQIRNVIAGGNEPTCRGTILGWADNGLAQSLVLAKRTPTVWSQLTEAEVNKCDWLMRALTVAGNYMQNYHNDPERCLLGVFEGRKTRAPNIQEGYVGVMIAAHHYFGGASAVNSMLADFDYDNWLSTFADLGFTNIIYGWTYAHGNTAEGRATMKQLMENGGVAKLGGNIVEPDGVRHPFTFAGYYGSTPRPEIAYEPFGIYEALAERMYRGAVHNKSTSGEVHILNNRVSPMTGLIGMCNELQGSDGSGERSSVRYAYDGWNNNILTYATLRALNLWGDSPVHQEIDRRIKTGSIDILYKYKAGYRGRSNGEIKVHNEPTGITLGYNFVKDIWINYLWDRKDLNLLELMSPTLSESFDKLSSLTGAFGDGGFTGEQDVAWTYTQARRDGSAGVKPGDVAFIALAPGSAGSLSTTLARPVTMLRFKTRNLSGSGSPSLTIKLNDDILRTYDNFGADETEVVAIPGLEAVVGARIVITNTGTAELLIDDLELEEVSGLNGPENLTGSLIHMTDLTLTWTDNATNETGFQLERRKVPGGAFQVVEDNLPANTTSYTDRGLEPETTYEYRLVAFNLAGLSTEAVTTVETLPLVAMKETILDAVADADVRAGTSYMVTNYGSKNFMNVQWAGATNAATREAFLKFDLTSITTPIRRASLFLNTTTTSFGTTNPLTAVVDLMQDNTWQENTITWNNRPTTSVGTLHTWDPVAGNNTVDLSTDLLAGKEGLPLSLRISVLETILFTVLSRESTNPAVRPALTIYTDRILAPANLVVSGSGRPVLTWTDNSDNETNFRIQRKIVSGGEDARIAAGEVFEELATVDANSTSYTDMTADEGITYAYRVYALDESGKSGYSNIAEVTTVLPVSLVTFKAQKGEGNVVQLAWTTSSELNSSYFAVERSADGKRFTEIGRVMAGKVSEKLKNYKFEDHSKGLSGVCFYRLRMVDLDGSFAYSRLVSVGFDAVRDILLYPNPSSELLFIQMDGPVEQVVFYDINGRIRKEAGSETRLDVSGLPTGIYNVVITRNGKRHSLRFLKE